MNQPTRCDRIHLVLVPGFGAFDALGQVEYYSGVTKLFNDWKGDKHSPVTLHYFDNLPTAAVTTRATKLRLYLAKRIARGEIQEHDAIVLVGHSTGGLDIRRLIWDLSQPENKEFPIDSGHHAASKEIRKRLVGVVFLSVPHWGTNIADWVCQHAPLRAAIVADLKAAVAGSQLYVLDAIETELTGGAASLTDAGMLLALKDALTEANEHYGPPTPLRRADAQEAYSELSFYFRQMSSDFAVIHDLTSEAHDPNLTSDLHDPTQMSPAHFNEKQRRAELVLWDHPRIESLSYATVGGRAFDFSDDEPVPAFELSSPCSYADIAKALWRHSSDDFSYCLCYRLCAGGPFWRPEKAPEFTRVLGRVPKTLKVWDNDGIVNTRSMFWPRGEHVLVAGDHLDIVGHFEPRKTFEAKRAGRRYQPSREFMSYDCLQSTPRFTEHMFEEVWNGVFDFAVRSAEDAQTRREGPRPKKRAAAA